MMKILLETSKSANNMLKIFLYSQRHRWNSVIDK